MSRWKEYNFKRSVRFLDDTGLIEDGNGETFRFEKDFDELIKWDRRSRPVTLAVKKLEAIRGESAYWVRWTRRDGWTTVLMGGIPAATFEAMFEEVGGYRESVDRLYPMGAPPPDGADWDELESMASKDVGANTKLWYRRNTDRAVLELKGLFDRLLTEVQILSKDVRGEGP